MPLSSGIFSKLRQNTVAVSRDIDMTDPGSTSRSRKPFKRQDTPRMHEDEPEIFPPQNQKRRPSPIRADGKGRSYQHGNFTLNLEEESIIKKSLF
jgi:hypothetical protein